jgi:hypothetical protein
VTDIQQARDVLAKWKKAQGWFPGPWAVRNEQPGRTGWADVIFDAEGDSLFTYDGPDGDEFSPTHDANTDPGVARLIVGTAGNPDLLDALDTLLKVAHEWKHGAPNKNVMLVKHAERLAAAIITADERMSK